MNDTNWQNLPNTTTPILAEKLNKLDRVITITENSDLNNFKTDGEYYFPASGTYTNMPGTVVNGWLIVMNGTDTYGTWVKQIFLRHGTPEVNDYQTYVRTYVLSGGTGVWSEWAELGALNYLLNYSTNEIKIGRWIDGNTIYKKTIKISNKAFSAGDNTIAHGISNFKQCIKAELKKDGVNIFPYFNYDSSNNRLAQTFIALVDTTNITIRVMNDSWGNQNIWYATLYYTKTV